MVQDIKNISTCSFFCLSNSPPRWVLLSDFSKVTFDESHRFAGDAEEPTINPWGESLMNDAFLSTPEHPKGPRKDIDQALSLLQLSGGSAAAAAGGGIGGGSRVRLRDETQY